MTAVSTLRDDLTFIVSVSLRKKMIYFLELTLPQYYVCHSFLQQAFTRKSQNSYRFKKFQEYPRFWIFFKVLESAWFVGFPGKTLLVLAAWIFNNIHEIKKQTSLQLGKTLSLEFHEYSRIFKRQIPASDFKLIQAVETPWIFKNILAHKSWKFLEIPSSIFLQVK